MTTLEKISLLKEFYTVEALPFYTDDAENIKSIDFDNEDVHYFTYVSLNCGCCIEQVDDTFTLTEFLENLSDRDFELLLNSFKK